MTARREALPGEPARPTTAELRVCDGSVVCLARMHMERCRSQMGFAELAAEEASIEPEVIVTVNGWLHDATPDEAHEAVCWPPHPREAQGD